MFVLLLYAPDAPPLVGAGALLAPPVLPPAFVVGIKSDNAATSTIEFAVENLFIFILPGPIITGDCLGISTSHILLGLGTTIHPIVEAID